MCAAPSPVPSDLVTPKAAAAAIHAHVATVYRLIHSGRLKAYKRGCRYLVSRNAALSLLEPVEVQPQPDAYAGDRQRAATNERLRSLGYDV